MDTASSDSLVSKLQDAFARASGVHPSGSENVRARWRILAHHILTGPPLCVNDEKEIAVELHSLFIGSGHRTEIRGFPEESPAVQGWRGVARFVLERQRLHVQTPLGTLSPETPAPKARAGAASVPPYIGS